MCRCRSSLPHIHIHIHIHIYIYTCMCHCRSSLTAYPRTADFASCRWYCTASLGCPDTPVDAYGPVGNVTSSRIECLVPQALAGHKGRVEVQLSLEGQHFIRPDNQGRNRVRPKIHYFFYRQRMYLRSPGGG